jgi:dinuclear metal center YbgI/SA1388 family protein
LLDDETPLHPESALTRTLMELVDYLDRYLEISSFQDTAENGLQVEGREHVRKVGLAVDACLQSILSAEEKGCDLLIVHHGLFWGAPIPLRGVHYRRLAALIRPGIALYAAHLPLDANPEVGNNARIADRLQLSNREPFARYGNRPLGVQGTFPEPLPWLDWIQVCRAKVGFETQLLRFGPDRVSRVAIVSGSATDPGLFQESARAGIDLLITGEPKHSAYYLAQELGLNVFYGGHYRTETFGVMALGEHLAERFGIEAEFIETACPI